MEASMAAIVWNKRASLPGPPEDDNAAHVRRVQDELRDAGATMYGLAKFSSQYLYRLVTQMSISAGQYTAGIREVAAY